MSRIRTIKPEFFRHEGLQDLEIQYPGRYPMLVFPGLWTLCDASGIFPWRPRQIKLDVLPFLDFDMEETLVILEQAGFLIHYSEGGKEYGMIPSFADHQRLSGKEAGEAGRKYPLPTDNNRIRHDQQHGNTCEATGKQRGSVGEAPVKHIGSNVEAPVKSTKNDDFRGKKPGDITHDTHDGQELIQKIPDNESLINRIEIIDISCGEATGKQRGSVGEIPVAQEKEREKEKEKERTTTFCSEPQGDSEPTVAKPTHKLIKPSSQTQNSPVVCMIPVVNPAGEYAITQAMVDEWQIDFPGIDVLQELRSCRAWNQANPTRRKTKKGIMRHVVSWMQRAQDKGHVVISNRSPPMLVGQTKTFMSNAIAINQAILEIQQQGGSA